MTRPEVFIVDWDGIIQFIDKSWMVSVAKNPFPFKDYFDFSKLKFGTKEFMDDLMGREHYYLNKWLQKNPNEELPAEVFDAFMRLYTEDLNFYDSCNFLVAADTMMNLANQSFCQEITFLSHVPYANGEDIRKKVIFEKFFRPASEKFNLVTIPNSVPKHEWILENKPYYTCVFDDRLDILEGIIDNTDSEKKSFFMPYLGYNKHFETNTEFARKIDSKGIVFGVYKQGFLEEWDNAIGY